MTTHQPAPASGAVIAAFFDVDNTIIRGATAFHIAQGLKQRGFIRKRDIMRFGLEQLKYLIFGESKKQMTDMRSEALSIIKGWSVAEMATIGEEVYDEVTGLKIFPGTKAILEEHLSQGHEVWLVTATPVEIGRIIARRLGATGALGTVAEHEGGHYTGMLVGDLLHGDAKATAVNELAAERSLDLSQSFAYGDSMNDVPMLNEVGNPCAINPDTRLRRYAKNKGWPMREFRGRGNGRRSIVRASFTGFVWVFLVVFGGIRSGIRSLFRRKKKSEQPSV